MNRLLNIQAELVSKVADPLDAEELKATIFGPNHKERTRAFEFMRANPGMLKHAHLTEETREEMRTNTLNKIFICRQGYTGTIQETKDNPNPLTLYSNGLVFNDLSFTVRAGVHSFLYLKSIFHLGTEKHQEFLERAFHYKDFGCFGLTELAHGSNVKGIQTEAHYDALAKQFVLHTPSKDAMKFWIGGAGQTANNAVIWAQLYIADRCYGVHAYIVPIRDIKTHKLLPGVLIGDCGPKNGLNGIDNGFIILDKVRVPWANQLDRISGVTEDGKFHSLVENDDKRFGLHLAALSGGRFFISLNCCGMSLAALTIAIRYTNERRQFKVKGESEERLLAHYPLTRHRLMPLLAQNIVYYIASIKAICSWDENQINTQDPSHPMIEQLHAISSVLKARTSWYASDVIRECRQMLGGNGFHSYSKLGVLFNDNDVNLTWEGDNHVLIQQTSKYVLEQAQSALQKGKTSNNPLLTFLNDPPSELFTFNRDNFLNLDNGLRFLQYKLMRKIEDTGLRMMELKQKKLSTMEIWNNSQVFLGRQVAEVYCDIACLTNIISSIDSAVNPNNKAILTVAARLWLLTVYKKDEFIDLSQHAILQGLIGEQAEQLAARSLELLEIISTDDEIIGSPFADPNGKGIEKYLSMIMSKPTNQRQPWWEIVANR